ncbi:hypothetical protein FXB39_17430 [Nocardioides sp. BGMRC 2183]|nr:hypothetical protein FXB39_17430 [Nocardioides sp. BGMRC 2183]
MWNRASVGNLFARLAAFGVFMIVLLGLVGFGVGVVELLLWAAMATVGVVVIVRRHRASVATTRA